MRHLRFTLVEMMIVVGIVAILAAIAIPKVYEMQLRAKRAEVYPNLSGIRSAVIAYIAAYDAIPAEGMEEPSWPRKTKQDWDGGVPFEDIEWAPDGAVYAAYSFKTTSPWWSFTTPCGDSDPEWAVLASQNLDGDLHVPAFAVTDEDIPQPTWCLCASVDGDGEFEAW